MSLKDMIKEVGDAAEDMALPKETDEVTKELKEAVAEKIEEIGEAADSMLHLEQNDIGADLGKKVQEIEDAAGAMIFGDKPEK